LGTVAANFSFDAYRRQGWGERADRVRALWLAGDRVGAADAVDDDMVPGTTLLGTEDGVRARLADRRAAGVTTVRLYPAGDTLDARLETLGRAVDLVRALG
jgi:hypothetical protein